MGLREIIGASAALLDAGEKRRAAWLLAAIIVSGLIETIGLTPIFPFLAVLAKPEVVQTNRYLSTVYQWFGFADQRGFLLFLGALVLAAVIVSNLANAWIAWRCQNFSLQVGHALSLRLLKRNLAQPYAYFLVVNSQNILVDVIGRVFDLVNGVISPALQGFAKSVLCVFIFILVFAVNPGLSISVAVVVVGGYVTAYLLIRSKVKAYGEIGTRANEVRGRIATEAFSGIKDVKVLGAERFFGAKFEQASLQYVTYHGRAIFASLLPRYLLEILAMGGMVGITLYVLSAGGELAQILPTLALFAFAAYRLMPAAQQVFQSLALIRYTGGSIDALAQSVRRMEEYVTRFGTVQGPPVPLAFTSRIAFDRVVFSYPEGQTPTINGISLSIPKGAYVGLVGATGSGKSTILDLVLGLLQPTSGNVLIDDVPLDAGNHAAWQKKIGYVSQHIYLIDASVLRNIAFGVADQDIDLHRAQAAARLAQIHEFIEAELPRGYETIVGERGIRLSGGQRQRIGIARALYRSPEVLILDEATNALDPVTERAVIEGLLGLAGEKTILHVTHRIAAVRDCTRIMLFDAGNMVEQGTFEQLEAQSPRFRLLSQ